MVSILGDIAELTWEISSAPWTSSVPCISCMYHHPTSPDDDLLSLRRLGLQRTEYDVQSKLSASSSRRQQLFAQNVHDARAVEDVKTAAQAKFEADRQNTVLRHTSPLKQTAFGSGSRRSQSSDWVMPSSTVSNAPTRRSASPAPGAASGKSYVSSSATAQRSASPATSRNYSSGAAPSSEGTSYQAAQRRFESPVGQRKEAQPGGQRTYSSCSVLGGRDGTGPHSENRSWASNRTNPSPMRGRSESFMDARSSNSDLNARRAEPASSSESGARYASPRLTRSARGRSASSGSVLGQHEPPSQTHAGAARMPMHAPLAPPSSAGANRHQTSDSILPGGSGTSFLSQPVEVKPRTLIGHFVQLKQTVPKALEQQSAPVPSTPNGGDGAQAAGGASSSARAPSPAKQGANQSTNRAPVPIPPAPAQGDIAMRLLRSFNSHVAKGKEDSAAAPPPPPRRAAGFPRPGGGGGEAPHGPPKLSRRGRSPSPAGAGRALSSGPVLDSNQRSSAALEMPVAQLPVVLSRRGRSPSPAIGRSPYSASTHHNSSAGNEPSRPPSPSKRFASANYVVPCAPRAPSPAPQALAMGQSNASAQHNTATGQPMAPPPPPPRRTPATSDQDPGVNYGSVQQSSAHQGRSSTPIRRFASNHSVMDEVMASAATSENETTGNAIDVQADSLAELPGRLLSRRVRGRSTTPMRGAVNGHSSAVQPASEQQLQSPPPPPPRRFVQQPTVLTVQPVAHQPTDTTRDYFTAADAAMQVESPVSPLSEVDDPQSPILEAVQDMKDTILKMEAARQADNKVLNDLKALCFDLEARDAMRSSPNASPSKDNHSSVSPSSRHRSSSPPRPSWSSERPEQAAQWVRETLPESDGPHWVQKVTWVQANGSSFSSPKGSPDNNHSQRSAPHHHNHHHREHAVSSARSSPAETATVSSNVSPRFQQRQTEEAGAANSEEEPVTPAQRRHAAAMARVQAREERARAHEEKLRMEEKFAAARREVKREMAAQGAVGDEQERFLYIEARTFEKVQAQERLAAQKAAWQNDRHAAEDEQTRLIAASESAVRARVEKEVNKAVAIEMAKFREVSQVKSWDTTMAAEHFDDVQREADATYVELTLHDLEARREEEKARRESRKAKIFEKEITANADVSMDSMARRAAEEERRNAELEWSDYRRKVEDEAEGIRAAVRERARLEKATRSEVDRTRKESQLRAYLDSEKRKKESAEHLASAFSAPSSPPGEQNSALASYAMFVEQTSPGAARNSEIGVNRELEEAQTPAAESWEEPLHTIKTVESSASMAAAVVQRAEERRKRLELAKAEADAQAAAAELARLRAIAEEERLLREAEEDRVRSAEAAAKLEADQAAAEAARIQAEREAAEAKRVKDEAEAVEAAKKKAELDHDEAVALAYHRVSDFLSHSKGSAVCENGDSGSKPSGHQ